MNPEKANNPNLRLVRKPAPYPDFFALPTAAEIIRITPLSRAYNRWDLTRRINPFIAEQSATGFEGYFIGLGLPPEAVAEAIAELGCSTLDSFRRLHPHEPSYISKLWKVAKGEAYDHDILVDLNCCLQATIARLRVKIHPQLNQQGDDFRHSVAKKVEAEQILFHGQNGTVHEHSIAVPATPQTVAAIDIDDTSFSRAELHTGYAFIKLLGKAGYPLVQLAIQKS